MQTTLLVQIEFHLGIFSFYLVTTPKECQMNILTAPPSQYLQPDEVVKLVAECEKVKINVQPITFYK